MTSALYGLVGILGVHIWVSNQVDFGKPINQFTAAIPLVIGIADFTWVIGDLDFGASPSAPSPHWRSTTRRG